MGARTKARKRAIDVVYEADQRALSTAVPVVRTLAAVLAERLVQPGTQTSLPEYSVSLVEGVTERLPAIDEALSTYSQGWTLERMPAVDRAILRVSTWELLYNDEVPDAVAIDEAIELARELSTDDSPTFINGLLGRLASLKATLLD
ncbi:transcription antitermination factor NusB [Pseudactinotalea terrae]|uniref:transcription antitermination factor NusB n=1 Tax=Pseudactinotalea terrae TaxID=1743262 RepID=UPI0012E17841|nr:transcription antitermination factor NusB [Pseudactinotalea terrae]